MNKLFFILTQVFISTQLFSQSEFEAYGNGLIYSEQTMSKLGRIVDSLNLKYKSCDMQRDLLAKSQTIGHIVTLETKDIKQAKLDMDHNISLELFLSKYPKAVIKKDVLVVKSKNKNYKGKELVEYSEVSLKGDYGFEIEEENIGNIYNKNRKNSWLYEYVEKSDYSEESLKAFYFPENFEARPIASKYSKQIGYADCLIDTGTTKFFDDAEYGHVDFPENWKGLKKEEQEKLLTEMRSIKVIGQCSQDGSPRMHAKNIALLSAETTHWEVFLKSHLDIMNDRFERMSDGSYAYARRNTYIKELEELDINVIDLLIGITLRIENPSVNHYYGSISRLGRAISETKNKQEFKSQILSMIEDPSLDNYNRVLAYYLFINYNHYIEEANEKNNNLIELKKSIQKLPVYIKDKIELNP